MTIYLSGPKAAKGSGKKAKPVPAVAKGRTYLVKTGDSPWSIAKAHYGMAAATAYAKKIMKLNKIRKPSELKVGTKIRLPVTGK